MNLLKKIFTLLFIVIFHCAYAWGPTGHRVVGEVASKNIKKRTLRKINKLLNNESLASVSTYADDIKSDPRYKRFYDWHFVNFPFNTPYEDSKISEKGDVIQAIEFCISTIKNKSTSEDDKAFYLKLLVHFIGDLHQPLHVGKSEDWGGNKIKLLWFKEESNLHKVWDENMIDHFRMSYTELANNLPYLNKKQKKEIQNSELIDWVYESQNLAKEVYGSAKEGDKLWYPYQYKHFGTVKVQLQKAGLRLAKVLDDLFA